MTYLKSRSGNIFAECEGRGEPMLLIPGLGMDHTYYRLASPILAKDFEVIAVDPRGIGQSDKKAPYSVESWAADFADVVGGFSELDRSAALNFGLRARLIRKLGMSDEVADYMGLWTLTREFINSDEGYAQMKTTKPISVRIPPSFISPSWRPCWLGVAACPVKKRSRNSPRG